MRYRYCLLITTILSVAGIEGDAAPSGNIDLGGGVTFNANTKDNPDNQPVPTGTMGNQGRTQDYHWNNLQSTTFKSNGAVRTPLNPDTSKGFGSGTPTPSPSPYPSPSPSPAPAPSPAPVPAPGPHACTFCIQYDVNGHCHKMRVNQIFPGGAPCPSPG